MPLAKDRIVTVAVLVRLEDWRPLRAPWWHGMDASIIGADTSGNFFLRHCDGSVRYWDNAAQADVTVASGIGEFCAKLEAAA